MVRVVLVLVLLTGCTATEASLPPLVTPSPTSLATASPSPSPTPQVRSSDETIRGPQWEYRVWSATMPKSMEFLGLQAKGAYILVTLEVTNLAQENVAATEDDFSLLDSKGRSYVVDPGHARFTQMPFRLRDGRTAQSARLGERVPPGVPVVLTLLFDVNPDGESWDLVLKRTAYAVRLGRPRST